MNVRRLLEERISRALSRLAGKETPALIAPAARPQFGDYQANGAMPAAKSAGTDPRKLAEELVDLLASGGPDDLSDLAERVELARPGFVNIRLRDDWLAGQVRAALGDDHLGADKADPPRRVVVDYSAPNLAKEMHVGHLRSTIIGDALARVLDFLGHTVIRQNHVGDWGTQFGILAAFYTIWMHEKAVEDTDRGMQRRAYDVPLEDAEEYYRAAQKAFDTDAEFAKRARRFVVDLQGGDRGCRILWEGFRSKTLDHCERVYSRLGTRLTRDDVRGESAYNDDLPIVVADLERAGLLTESEGAKCVFLEGFTGKDGKPLPLIVQKSDEGYLYSTTDLAAIRYRTGVLKADRILYVVDARQSLHFRQVFTVARKAGFAPDSVALDHVAFGTMMGPDGRPFKTREGGVVKLMDLLGEAERRALDLVRRKNPDLPEAEQGEIARVVGIGAVKYADLAQNRTSDYVFSWDKMLSLDGNTAPYMQYAYARIRSIFRKGASSPSGVVRSAPGGRAGPPAEGSPGLCLSHPAERALALRLVQFAETVAAVASECLPNLLCSYLYDLAVTFTGFYENCPVLRSDEPVRSTRLALCDATAGVIRQGLDLLGIQTVEQM